MRPLRHRTAALLLAALLLPPAVGVLAAPRAAPTHALVMTTPAHILVDDKGMTLYIFSLDKPHKSVCTGPCAALWRPLVLPTGATAPATVAGIAGQFGVAVRAGGARQLTYDGAPLYTFTGDKAPGDMLGQGVNGVWWAVAVRVTGGNTSAGAGKSSGGGTTGGLSGGIPPCGVLCPVQP